MYNENELTLKTRKLGFQINRELTEIPISWLLKKLRELDYSKLPNSHNNWLLIIAGSRSYAVVCYESAYGKKVRHVHHVKVAWISKSECNVRNYRGHRRKARVLVVIFFACELRAYQSASPSSTDYYKLRLCNPISSRSAARCAPTATRIPSFGVSTLACCASSPISLRFSFFLSFSFRWNASHQ